MTSAVQANLIASSKPISRDRARTPSCALTPNGSSPLSIFDLLLDGRPFLVFPFLLSRYSAERLAVRIRLKNLATWN